MDRNSGNFLNELMKFSSYEDKGKTKQAKSSNNENTNIDDLIKNMESDQGLINIIKSYHDYENEKKNSNQNNEDAKEAEMENSILFSNHLIQSSFTRYNTLKKIILRKENVLLIYYLDRWRDKIKKEKKESPKSHSKSSIPSIAFINTEDDNVMDYLEKNRKVIEAYCEDSEAMSDFDYLSPEPIKKNSNLPSYPNYDNYDNYNLPLQSPRKKNICIPPPHEKKSLCLVIKNTLSNKLKNNLSVFISKLQQYINSKKLTNSSLSLLYIFTQLTIAKNKSRFPSSNNNSKSNNEQKLFEYEKKIAKYESCLNEKADIIASRNDRIEQQIETIELLSEEINRLNNKIEKLEKRSKNLNVVEESLCGKCGNSLEESFMCHKEPKSNVDSCQINELKKTIQEQLDYIVKMESEMRDLRLKNVDFKTKNELIINELEIIKTEFKQITDSYNKKANNNLNIGAVEESTQTEVPNSDTQSLNKKLNNTSNSNLKKSSKKFSNKLTLKSSQSEKSSNKSANANNNITNYNIININNTSNLSASKFSQNDSNLTISMNDSEREVVQGLRFDNSLLTHEIVNLNKELTKLKNESKQITDINKKLDKERTDIMTKLKNKSENFDKIKKENEELMILIQTSNYKSFVSVETENKKLKQDNINFSREAEAYKNELTLKEKRMTEIESELDKTKKTCESLIRFKNERENLILENAKFESELKSVKYELENSKNIVERQNILLRKQDETITKINEDMNYLNFNAKKSKQDSDRAIQDALTYQQIVRKLEKDLLDCQLKKEKVETELNIIKQQLGIKK